jgi:hypothetical protein
LVLLLHGRYGYARLFAMAAPSRDTVERVVAETPGARFVPTETDEGMIEAPWVPYGPGFEIPLYFEYEGDGPFDWKLTVLVIEGRPQCIQLEFGATDPTRPITPERLHRFQLGRFLKEATLMMSAPADEIPRRYRRWSSIEEARAARATVERQYRKRRPTVEGKRVLTDEFLTEVAEIYRQNVATGAPSKAVAEHFHYTRESARRVVSEARLRGLLGPARPGRVGERSNKEGTDG